MFDRAAASTVSETPWGQSWSEVLSSLRPTSVDDTRLSNIVNRVSDAIRFAGIEGVHVIAGGAFGKGTHTRGHRTLDLYAIFQQTFHADDYFEKHLKHLFDAISATKESPFVNITDRGLAIEFCTDDVDCRLFAAGKLRGGPRDLLRDEPPTTMIPSNTSSNSNANLSRSLSRASSSRKSISLDTNQNPTLAGVLKTNSLNDTDVPSSGGMVAPSSRNVHLETSIAVLRSQFLSSQPTLYKDMVRVARKWRDTCDFLISASKPNDYLLELLMLESFYSVPALPECPDLYAAMFRRFLSLITTRNGTAPDAIAAVDSPPCFLVWTTFYSRATVDYCLAKGLLTIDNTDVDGTSLVVIDPAVPFINVASTVKDWTELRAIARDSLSHFQSTEMVQVLDGRLQTLTASVDRKIGELTQKLEALEQVEKAPRRWTGQIQFRDEHMASEAWVLVMETELRCLTWRLLARRPRIEDTGYHQIVDISLQVVGDLPRPLDVDVSYRGQESRVRFDESTDHVLIARRSEVMRNRDYSVQITIVS